MPDPDPYPANGNLAWSLLLLAVLIGCNAFFAASEIAIISLNDNKIRKMAEDGHKKARHILRLTENSSRFLATIQMGVTLAGFMTSAAAATAMADPLAGWLTGHVSFLSGYASAVRSASLVVITLLVSYVSLVFGELVPKRIAMQKCESVSFAFIGILRGIAAFLRPFVTVLSFTTNCVLRLLRIDPRDGDELVTEEEIRMLVDVGEEKGVIEESQKEMIINIFEFDDTTAEEIMTPRTDVSALEVGDSLEEALAVGVDEGYSRLPVYEEDIDHIIGMLYVKDMLPYVGRLLPDSLSLRDFIRPTYFVPGTKRCGELFAEMTEKRLHMAVVVDEYGGVAGIVTMEDLLESIVGNMQDEFDHEEDEITRLDENSFVIDGSADVESVGELVGAALPEGDYDTIAGFLLDQLGRIPNLGDQVTFDHTRFTVNEMEDRRIVSVHVKIESKTDAGVL